MNVILIVDDNPDDREFLSRSVRRHAAIDHEGARGVQEKV